MDAGAPTAKASGKRSKPSSRTPADLPAPEMPKVLCSEQNKQCYTKGAAIKAALSYSRKRGTPLRMYWHHSCKSYHLTKNAKW